jgi:HPt (histidine-containing phosphotransfer) domain-containing protein
MPINKRQKVCAVVTIAALRNLIGPRVAGATPGETMNDTDPQPPSTPPTLDAKAIERLRALATSVARPGEDILGHITRLFVDDSAVRLAALREAWVDGRAKDAARAAHTIKGAAANVGALRVIAAAVAVEAGCTGSFDEDAFAGLAAELAAAAQALQAEFSTTR